MATRIKPKRSETSSSVPTTSNLAVGEIAVNSADRKIYTRDSNDNIVTLAQPGLLNVVEDTTPQLGGDLDVNGNSITSSADIQLDAETQIKLDANSAGNIWLQDNGTTYGKLYNFNGMKIESSISDNDFQISVNDGGSFINAITIDASEAGAATFSDKIVLGANKSIEFGNSGETITGDGTNLQIVSSNALGFDVANGITLDSGSGGTILKAGGGTTYGSLVNSSGDLIIKSGTTTALTFSGANVTVGGDLTVDTNTLYVDSANNRVGIGTTSPSAPLEITTTSTDDTILLTSTEDTSTASPVITLKRNSGSVADADYLGQLKFKGENDADQEITYAKVTAKIQDASDASEDGLLEFANMKAGTQTITARLRSDSLQLLNGTSLTVAGDTTLSGTLNTHTIPSGTGTLALTSDLGLSNVVEDTTPQLGGDLDLNSSDITGTGNINITGSVTACGSFVRVRCDNSSIVVDDSGNSRLGLIKKGGSFPALIAGSATPLILGHSTNCANIIDPTNATLRTDLCIATGGDVTITCNLTVSGDLTVSGTTTTVNTETINLADNVIVLNSNATGSATENAGIEVERGDDANKTLIWNETTDKWTVGAETFNACTLEVDDGSTTWPFASKSDNLHIGTDASCSLTTGTNNIAVGCQSLKLNEDGSNNVAIGQNSLCCATTPSSNIVIGKNSLCASDECTFVAMWDGSSYPTVTCSTIKNIVIGNDLLSNEIMSSYNTVIGNDIATCASSCVFSYGCTCCCQGVSAIPFDQYNSYNNTLIGNCIAPFAERVDKSVMLGSNIAFSVGNTRPIRCSQIFGYNIMNCANTDCGGYGYVNHSFLAGTDMFKDSPICQINRTIAIGNEIGVPGTYNCKRTEFVTHDCSILLGDYVSQFGLSSSSVSIGLCSTKTLYSNNNSVFIGAFAGEGQFSCNNTRRTCNIQNIAIGSNAMGQIGYDNTTTPDLTIRDNTTVGNASLHYVSGNYNTALGSMSGHSITTGDCNTTLGSASGNNITTGSCNTLIGRSAGSNLTTGNTNIIIGHNVQPSSNTVSNETTIGGACLRFPGISSTSGDILCYNGTHWVSGTAASSISNVVEDTTPQLGGNLDVNGKQITSSSNGDITIFPNGTGCVRITKIDVSDCSCFQGSHPTGFENIQLGTQAGQYWYLANTLNSNCIQCCNTAIGGRALRNHCHGDNNVAIGHSPLLFQISASDNVAVGSMAGYCNVSGERNVFIGHQSGFNSLGCCNTTLGYSTGSTITTGCNLTVLGHNAEPSSATVSNEITLGDANITSLRIPGLQSGAADGQVLTYCSSNGNIVLKDAGGGGSISCFSYDSGSSALVATADLTSTCSALFGDVLISGNTITPDDSNTVTCLGADGTLNISGNLDVQGDFLKLPQADSCSTIVGNTASAGALRYNTTTNTIQVHNGTEFTGIAGGGGLGDLTTAVTTGSANSCETTIQSPTDENIVLDPQGTGTTCVLGNLVVSCDVTSSSDERLKENIMPIENALNVVTAMSGKTFNMKDDESKQCKIGFIAQQIEEHLPHVVATDKDGMKSVDYGKITALLVEAIKELNKKIEDMK